MIEAVISFLGGSVFRMVWGELSSYFTRKQEHAQEVERMRLQAELDQAAHIRQLQAIKVQADMQVQVVRVQGETAVDTLEAEGWLEAVKATGQKVGVLWVDAWNAVIRPGLATWGVFMLTANEFGWLVNPLSDGTAAVIFAAIGIFVADRSLGKRGK